MGEERLMQKAAEGRLYSLCFFDRGWVVPEVQFVEAGDDEDALAMASSLRPWMTRELWDKHRLVRVLPPAYRHTATQ